MIELPNAGSGDCKVTPLQRINGREELLAAQRGRAAERRLAAGVDEFRHAAYVIVVPVGRDDHVDGAVRIEAEAFQVLQGAWISVSAETGIDDHPDAMAGVQDDALVVSGAEDSDFEHVVARRLVNHGHRPNARAVSLAHARAPRMSVSVITGRSRNTICETRFFVPVTERS